MNTSWIKRHEKLPAMDDLPIITTCYEGGKWRTQLWTEYTPRAEHEYTYWTRFRAEPPPRELTQRERDEQWVDSNSWPQLTRAGAMLQAIYAERREVAKLLASYFCSADWGLATNSPALNSLRARLDELGGGK